MRRYQHGDGIRDDAGTVGKSTVCESREPKQGLLLCELSTTQGGGVCACRRVGSRWEGRDRQRWWREERERSVENNVGDFRRNGLFLARGGER